MPEKVLPYDRNIVPQETGWWCGGASCQVVLNSRGIIKTERSITLELEELEGNRGWDDQDGTDHISQITTVLNRHTKAGYVTRSAPRDPMTADQKNLLWSDIVASIDAGFGVVINIDVSPGNYPRGTRGSVSPAYGGGRVLHYMTVMGYYEGPDGRHVWIADSGFRPFGYWASFDQCATWIPPKGWTAAPLAKKPEPEKSFADVELSKEFPSRSKYRTSDEPVGTLADYILWIDARVHEKSVEGR